MNVLGIVNIKTNIEKIEGGVVHIHDGEVSQEQTKADRYRYAEEAEVIEEDVPEPVKKATAQEEVLRNQPLASYLSQLMPLVNAAYRDKFESLINRLLDDDVIEPWLSKANRCSFKSFNKLNVYKLCRMLRFSHVLVYETDYSLNPILEGTTDDNSYRKSMTKSAPHDKEIEDRLHILIRQI